MVVTVSFEFARTTGTDVARVAPVAPEPRLHVVGVDLSMRSTGLAVIRPQSDYRRLRLIESVKDSREGDDPYPFLYARVRDIGRRIRAEAFAARQAGDPTLIVIEGPAMHVPAGQSHRHSMSWLWGRTYEVLSREGAVVVVPPASLKRYVSGKGNADKLTMMHAATTRAFPGIDFTHRGKVNDNLVDAYGLAAMGCRELGFPVEPSAQRVTPESLQGAQWHTPRLSTIEPKGITT
jgi:crossover junction endodeoxyribonuclease RuvC